MKQPHPFKLISLGVLLCTAFIMSTIIIQHDKAYAQEHTVSTTPPEHIAVLHYIQNLVYDYGKYFPLAWSDVDSTSNPPMRGIRHRFEICLRTGECKTNTMEFWLLGDEIILVEMVQE